MREYWAQTYISEVSEIISGKNQSKVVDPDGEYPIYGSGGIIGTANDYLCESGTTIIGRKGTINSPIYISQKLWNVDTAFGFYPKNILLNKLLYFFCLSFNFKKLDKSTAVPSLAKRDLLKIDFKLPPLPEQRAIISKIEQLFSELDNGIKSLEISQKQLKVYRQAVLKKAFEGELTKEWREKQTSLPSADELLEQIKIERENNYQKQMDDWAIAVEDWEDDDKEGKKPTKPKKLTYLDPLTDENIEKLPCIPNSWKYNNLLYAGDLGRGKSKHRPRNDKKLFGGIYPFIQTAEVKAQDIITKNNKTYSEFGLQQSKLWPKGTLCITIAANIAETGFLGIDACFPDSIVGFTPFEKVISSKYIKYFFQSAKTKISAWAPATAQKNINLTILENLVIPYCSLVEQIQIIQEIETRLSVCDNVEEIIKENLSKSEALRQSILKKAFEGKLLSDSELESCRMEPDWEPASELLKKIQLEKSK